MRMRAAVLERFGEPLAVQEVELAEPRAGEVLVRLHACGVCHTDLYTASGADPSGYAPTVLGHEGAGVVEAVGADVASLAPGDHVVTLFSPQCRECVHCLDPRTNLCLAIREEQNKGHLPDGTTRISRGGEEIRSFMGCSTFAEYTVMPEIALAKVSPEAPFEHACLFACGLSTGLGAAINTAAVRPGSSCAVFGAGMVGLGAVAGCRLQGAERIICVDLSPQRLELARGQGATDLLEGGEGTVERILELTGGFGADYAFDAIGGEKTAVLVLDAIAAGGHAVLVGIPAFSARAPVSPSAMVYGEKKLTGTYYGSIRPPVDFGVLADLDMDKRINLDALISRTYKFDEINEGFKLLTQGAVARGVIVF